MLAHALRETVPSNAEMFARSRAELDVTDADAISRELAAAQPDVIINAAAYTAVDRAESDLDSAERVNGVAPGLLGTAAARIGAKVVHYSTDHVFDGKSVTPYAEDAGTNPINAYGRSKLHGEQALHASGANHVILRTQWLFADVGRSFPDTMWTRARAGLQTRVVDDQRGAPTYAGDLARATWSLLDEEGIIHVVSDGATTWFEVARRVFAAAGCPELLAPCSASEYLVDAQRPPNAVLDTTRLRSLGIILPTWTVAIDGFIARRTAAES
ncbi:MAG: dTDP-4-dehydrorhamnose reductase [Gemmatimonadetes bacterium]|nr:dTDP-4-dehydrorhamnose reductase [Gemmatimonadota bacterium]